MSVRDRARGAVVLALWGSMFACGQDVPPGVTRKSIGPDGGLIATDDDVLTIILQPGALGEWVDLEIERSDEPPPSFGPAYRVRPNVVLEVYSEVIFRDDLPVDPSSAAIGAIHIEDFEEGLGDWRALPREPGGLIVSEKTLHARDNQIALYYALLDEGGVADTSISDSLTSAETVDPTMTTTDPDTSTGDTGPPVSFATDIQPIFTARCATPACHDATTMQSMLDLGEGSYDRIVNMSVASSRTLAVPGNLEMSYLYRKVDGDLPDGDLTVPMPPTGGPLDGAQIGLIESWILQGCPP